jgi:hypothetical protein
MPKQRNLESPSAKLVTTIAVVAGATLTWFIVFGAISSDWKSDPTHAGYAQLIATLIAIVVASIIEGIYSALIHRARRQAFYADHRRNVQRCADDTATLQCWNADNSRRRPRS